MFHCENVEFQNESNNSNPKNNFFEKKAQSHFTLSKVAPICFDEQTKISPAAYFFFV